MEDNVRYIVVYDVFNGQETYYCNTKDEVRNIIELNEVSNARIFKVQKEISLEDLNSNTGGVFDKSTKETFEDMARKNKYKMYRQAFERESENLDSVLEVLSKYYPITDEEFDGLKKWASTKKVQ
ncbi:hypothetical protein ACE198_04995 [Neobacillus sp. KR4-4]|uniref:hypothetical protein n=1 Tax=Neobacillus sp. KR4-4 TaxID=3344872 RepID=UPI0035CA0E23